jgi:hypothetical protein
MPSDPSDLRYQSRGWPYVRLERVQGSHGCSTTVLPSGGIQGSPLLGRWLAGACQPAMWLSAYRVPFCTAMGGTPPSSALQCWWRGRPQMGKEHIEGCHIMAVLVG